MTTTELIIFSVSPALLGLAAALGIILTGRQDRRHRTVKEKKLEGEIARLMGELQREREQRKASAP